MIKSVHFQNFKALIDATLPLNRFTLIVGPNGSGKSTAMQGLWMARNPLDVKFSSVVTASLKDIPNVTVEIRIDGCVNNQAVSFRSGWHRTDSTVNEFVNEPIGILPVDSVRDLVRTLNSFQI